MPGTSTETACSLPAQSLMYSHADGCWLSPWPRELGSHEPELTLLDNDQVEHTEVLGHDASPHGLSPALSPSAAIPAEAGVAWGHEEAHTTGYQHTLLHGEALLVLATHDLEDVTFELLQSTMQWFRCCTG